MSRLLISIFFFASAALANVQSEVRTRGSAVPKFSKENLGRPFAIFGIVSRNFNFKSDKPCKELYEEYLEASGYNWLNQNTSEDDVFYVFGTRCYDDVVGERTVVSSAWVAAYTAKGDELIRKKYESGWMTFGNKRFHFEEPTRTMAMLYINHTEDTGSKNLKSTSGAEPFNPWDIQLVVNVPFHKHETFIQELLALMKTQTSTVRREKMLELLTENLPDFSREEIETAFQPLMTATGVILGTTPVFQFGTDLWHPSGIMTGSDWTFCGPSGTLCYK